MPTGERRSVDAQLSSTQIHFSSTPGLRGCGTAGTLVLPTQTLLFSDYGTAGLWEHLSY